MSARMSYKDMAVEAVETLAGERGSSTMAIEKHIKATHSGQAFKRHLLRAALKKLLAEGALVLDSKRSSCYRIPSEKDKKKAAKEKKKAAQISRDKEETEGLIWVNVARHCGSGGIHGYSILKDWRAEYWFNKKRCAGCAPQLEQHPLPILTLAQAMDYAKPLLSATTEEHSNRVTTAINKYNSKMKRLYQASGSTKCQMLTTPGGSPHGLSAECLTDHAGKDMCMVLSDADHTAFLEWLHEHMGEDEYDLPWGRMDGDAHTTGIMYTREYLEANVKDVSGDFELYLDED